MSTKLNSNGGRTAKVLFIDQLDEEIGRRQRELGALLHARNVLSSNVAERHHKSAAPATGPHQGAIASRTANPTTVSEGVEMLLRQESGHELHLDQIVEQLESRFSIRVTRKNLANTLNRWLSRGKKFDRVKTNTYTLR